MMWILTMVLTPVLATWGLGGATEYGRLEVIGHIKVLHLHGSYYEMGKAHGRLLRAEIAAVRKDHTVREWSDPQQKKEWEAWHRDPWIKHVPKRYLEEMQGLAEGSGLPLHVIEYAQDLGYGSPRSRALVLHGSKTVVGKPILAQATEFRWFSELLVIVYHPTDALPHVVLTCPGCLNALAGMNRNGIAISANIPYNENYFMERCPRGFLLREALRQAKSEREAVAFLEKAQPADHAMFLVVGRNPCDCRVVERTPKLAAVFEANDPSERGPGPGFQPKPGNQPGFQPLPECLRRSFCYASHPHRQTLAFFCGFFAGAMMDQGQTEYDELTQFAQSIVRPASAADILNWLRKFRDNRRDDYHVVFLPGALDFWLACAMPGDEKSGGAGYQKPQRFQLSRLLDLDKQVKADPPARRHLQQ